MIGICAISAFVWLRPIRQLRQNFRYAAPQFVRRDRLLQVWARAFDQEFVRHGAERVAGQEQEAVLQPWSQRFRPFPQGAAVEARQR